MGLETFSLQIVTPDGLLFSGFVTMVNIRTIVGNIGIRARHIDYVTAIGMGECRVDLSEDTSRYAACIGGLLAITNGQVRIVATTFEWAQEIDIERATAAKTLAEEIMNSDLSPQEQKQAKAKLQRALVRLGVTQNLQNHL